MLRASVATVAVGAMLIGGIGCGDGDSPELGAPLPVTDGTFFRYADETGGAGGFPRTITVRLEEASGGTFRCFETFRVEPPGRPEYAEESTSPVTVLRQDGIVLGFADESLKANALGEEQVLNRLAKIWLSPEHREPGAEVALEGFPGSASVGASRTWKRWQVVVIAPYGYEYYFERDTGFLVGWTTEGGDTWVLESTNAAGLGGRGR